DRHRAPEVVDKIEGAPVTVFVGQPAEEVAVLEEPFRVARGVLPDIPRMTPKPAWRVAILQRPWKPDGRYGWLPAARAARETPSALTFPVTQDIIVATLTGYDRTCSLPERSSSFFSSLHRNNRHMIGKPLSSKEGEYLPCLVC